MTTSLRTLAILTLSTLFLAACAPDRVTVVFVTIRDGKKAVSICLKYSNVVDEEGNPMDLEEGPNGVLIPQNARIKCTASGGRVDCGSLSCSKRETRMVDNVKQLTLYPEEFQFRYDHDKAFHDSVVEYNYTTL